MDERLTPGGAALSALLMVWLEEDPKRARDWIERAAAMLEGSVFRDAVVKIRGPSAQREVIEVGDIAARRLRELLLIADALPARDKRKRKKAKKRVADPT